MVGVRKIVARGGHEAKPHPRLRPVGGGERLFFGAGLPQRWRIDAMSERVIDLMVEDQRQTGDTQQQHEGRAVQPDPLMDEVPQV
jgi:hypothetical protein